MIPTRDTRELTLRCLAALWLCQPQPDEVIVVDDGSRDETVQSVVRKYPRHIVVRLPRSEGFAGAANHGLARASGDLLLLLNSDTEIERSALAAVRQAFGDDPKLGIAGAALKHSDGSRQWSGGKIPTTLWCFALASGLPALIAKWPLWRRLRSPSGSNGGSVEWVAGTAMVMRRQVWDSLGPFDTGFNFYCQDIDLCYAAARRGWGVEIIDGFRVLHHHGGSIHRQTGAVGSLHPELMWTDLCRFADKRFGNAQARRTAGALKLGGAVRLLGRRLATPLVPAERREAWDDATSAYARAVHAIDAVHEDRADATS